VNEVQRDEELVLSVWQLPYFVRIPHFLIQTPAAALAHVCASTIGKPGILAPLPQRAKQLACQDAR
jgi:hypothetical protein